MKDLNHLEKSLNWLINEAHDVQLKVLSANLAETLKNTIERSFETERGFDGAPWKPRKTGRDDARKILYKSGNLSNQWATESSAYEFCAFNPARSKDGKPYGIYHQFGTKKMPARPFLPLNKEGCSLSDGMQKELLDEVEQFFNEVIKKAFKS